MKSGETPGDVVEAGGSGESAEGHDRSDFGSSKSVAATGILQAWQIRGIKRGG